MTASREYAFSYSKNYTVTTTCSSILHYVLTQVLTFRYKDAVPGTYEEDTWHNYPNKFLREKSPTLLSCLKQQQ